MHFIGVELIKPDLCFLTRRLCISAISQQIVLNKNKLTKSHTERSSVNTVNDNKSHNIHCKTVGTGRTVRIRTEYV